MENESIIPEPQGVTPQPNDAIQPNKDTRKIGLIAICLGFTGLHDLMLKKTNKAKAHFALAFVPMTIFVFLLIALFFGAFKCGTGDTSGCKTTSDKSTEQSISVMIDIFRYVAPITFIGSWVWGIAEGVALLQSEKK